jgi:hypothetical protein
MDNILSRWDSRFLLFAQKGDYGLRCNHVENRKQTDKVLGGNNSQAINLETKAKTKR